MAVPGKVARRMLRAEASEDAVRGASASDGAAPAYGAQAASDPPPCGVWVRGEQHLCRGASKRGGRAAQAGGGALQAGGAGAAA